MSDPKIEATVTGGQIQGIVGAGHVVIENLNFYSSRAVEEAGGAGADQPIPPCPYPGLAYFGPGDADLFFGRDAAIARLVAAIGRQGLTALVGASGSGKSSVVLAGLAPRLHATSGWRFSHFRVGAELERNPFLALARALVPLYVASESDTERLRNTRQLAENLERGDLTLHDVFADCRSRNKATRILLIADQFEEAFTLIEDEAILHRFIDVLLKGFSNPPTNRPDICLILTLRADFYGQALRHRPLADALQGHVENLGPMNRAELQDAIRRPAENSKVSFDPGLAETLLDEVESRPGSLPLLQFALREMWGRQEQRRITRRSYDDIGGVEQALAQRAETIFATMTANGTNQQMEQDFRRLFTRLVTFGEGQEDTRRIVDRGELGSAAWSLAQSLAGEDNRLVVTSAPTLSHETAEVAHEALIRHWPRLVDWVNRDRAFHSWLRQIRSNVDLWSADPSDDGPLLRGGVLAQAREWLDQRRDDLSATEHGYIEASLALQARAEEERETARQAEVRRQRELADEERRRARIAFIGGFVALLLAIAAIGAGYLAYTAMQQANQNAVLAIIAKQRADLNAKAAREMGDKARAQLLGIRARRAAESATVEGIERAGALALESIWIARRNNWPAEVDAVEIVRSALISLPLRFISHGSRVRSLVALADGRLASGGEDGTIKLWPKDGTGEPVVLSHGSGVRSLAVLADGRVASGGEDGTIKLWPKDGSGEPAVLSHGSGVLSLAVLADGRLASGGEGGTIKLWPTYGTGEPVVFSHGGWVLCLAVLADGRLASGGGDGTIKLWPKDGTGAPTVLSHGGQVESLAVLADGRLVSGGEGGTIKLWPKNVADEPVVLSHGSWVFSLTELVDGRLASSGDDGTIKLWPKGGTGDPVVLPHGRRVYALAVQADGRLASGSIDGTIKLWPKNGTGEPEILSHGNWVRSLTVLVDGRLASGASDGTIKLWPKDGAGELEVFSQGRGVWSLAVLADGRLASGDEDGTIKLWPKNSTGRSVDLWHGGGLRSLVALADGRLASGGNDGMIRLWPKDGTGEPVLLSHDDSWLDVECLTVLADGRLASGGYDGTIKLWPKDGMGDPVILAHGSPVASLATLADGRLASGGYDGTIKLWPKDGVGDPSVLSHGSWIRSLAVLVDGRLASGGRDGKIKLWPKEGVGEPVVLSQGNGVWSLAVLPDGRLASGDEGGTIKLWHSDERELMMALCFRAGQNLTKEEWVRYIGSDTPWQPSCRDLPSNWRSPD
jgi:WD40 repeat protein